MERRAAPWGHRNRAAMLISGDLVGVGLQLAWQGQQLRGEQKPVCLSVCSYEQLATVSGLCSTR